MPAHSSNHVPSPEEFKKSSQNKSKAGTHSSTGRLLEPPPPSYDEVVSSAESSPRLGRPTHSAASEHEYHSIDEYETDSQAYEEPPASDVSKITSVNFRIRRVC